MTDSKVIGGMKIYFYNLILEDEIYKDGMKN